VPEIRMYTGYGMNGTIVKPPYSTLTAYDLNTGTIKWQVPAGGDDARAASEGAKDTGYIFQRTGIITTPTGLLFHAGGDRTLRVYDADTGTVLWSAPLPAGSRGIPAMYAVNGRQFFLVSASSSLQGAGASRTGGAAAVPAYVAFALPEAASK
jgi:quinoprotein glucose dehydrogenase